MVSYKDLTPDEIVSYLIVLAYGLDRTADQINRNSMDIYDIRDDLEEYSVDLTEVAMQLQRILNDQKRD